MKKLANKCLLINLLFSFLQMTLDHTILFIKVESLIPSTTHEINNSLFSSFITFIILLLKQQTICPKSEISKQAFD